MVRIFMPAITQDHSYGPGDEGGLGMGGPREYRAVRACEGPCSATLVSTQQHVDSMETRETAFASEWAWERCASAAAARVDIVMNSV